MTEEDSIEEVLRRMETGEADLDDLIRPLYGDLHRMADRCMQNERAGHTLQPTALVNEAFLKCAALSPGVARSRAEFLALAARVMRNTLVDHARARSTRKRQAPRSQVSLGGLEEEPQGDPIDMLALHEALEELEALDPRQARILELSAFGGLSGQEIADRLDLHRNTVVRELRMGRAWLRRALDVDA